MQNDASFQACTQLTKLLWNREFAPAWPVLRDTAWPEAVAPLAEALQPQLRRRVADFIGKAYCVINVSSASTVLGLSEEDTIQSAFHRKTHAFYRGAETRCLRLVVRSVQNIHFALSTLCSGLQAAKS